ncbi:unnamed protein product [Citrullus colocynthis]|uniref:Glycoside hydrolase family 3 N-terminal domain-containing protein n=1 Tax=Citrullus colocynthis TaxID=252529 RepID=A0ABP0YNI6_9ROSI
MCSYNAINGVPACANPALLQKARNDWGLKGYITLDCDAVATIFEYQKYIDTPEDVVDDILKAVDQGKVKEEELDSALHNLFSVQIRLKLFVGNPKRGEVWAAGSTKCLHCTTQNSGS